MANALLGCLSMRMKETVLFGDRHKEERIVSQWTALEKKIKLSEGPGLSHEFLNFKLKTSNKRP